MRIIPVAIKLPKFQQTQSDNNYRNSQSFYGRLENNESDSFRQPFRKDSISAMKEAYPDDEDLKIYLDSIKQYQTIGKKETIKLFDKMAEGGEDAPLIREKLILANLRLVPFTILKYAKHSTLPVTDLIQEGNIALTKAVDTYDNKKGCTFATHAMNLIKFAFADKNLKNTGLIKIPPEIMLEIKKLQKMEDSYIARYHEKPSNTMLAKLVEDYPGRIQYLKRILRNSVDIDTPIYTREKLENNYEMRNNYDATNDDRYTFSEMLTSQDNVHEQVEYRDKISCFNNLLNNNLAPREKFVVSRRWGLNGIPEMSLGEISKYTNVTRARVSQLDICAIRRLKESHAREKEILKEYL